MSDSGLGFSLNRFIGLMVLIAVITLLFEWVSDFGGGLIKAQVEQTTSKYDPDKNIDKRKLNNRHEAAKRFIENVNNCKLKLWLYKKFENKFKYIGTVINETKAHIEVKHIDKGTLPSAFLVA